ncbi:MAG: WYL domain-containing protein [Pirellulales bacterium]
MNASRVTRLLEVIGLLQQSRGHNVNSLAVACGVGRRTIFRDLQTLRSAGVPLAYDEDFERYSIPGQYYLPPTNFTADEALAVLVLCSQLGDHRQLPFYAAAVRAAQKLESSLPTRLRDQVRATIRGIEIKFPPASPLSGSQPNYEQLVAALAARRSVRIGYDSLTEWTQISTKLSPYRLLYSRHSWYVIGRSSLHRSTRTFHVGRIVQLDPLDDRYEIPHGFSLERYLGNAWHLIPESGADHEVRVRFRKMVAQNVAEVLWHRTQRCQILPDGSLDYQVTVSGLGEISWWILGYGDQAEVLAPARLREMVAERVGRMGQIYTATPETNGALPAPRRRSAQPGSPRVG